MPPPRADLAAVLAETADRLDRSPESPWAGVEPQALAADLRAERASLLDTGALRDLRSLRTLFLPTGEIQETALDGGWGDAYLDLAARFDEALAAYRPPPRPSAAASAPAGAPARRPRRAGRWVSAALAVGLVAWAGLVGGGQALAGVALIGLGVVVALAGAFFWIFQDGLFTRLPTVRQTLRDPRRWGRVLVPLVVSAGLVAGGAWLVSRVLDSPAP